MRILFVAMPNSIHSARWIGQLQGDGHEIGVFAPDISGPHAELRDVTFFDGLTSHRPPGMHPSVRRLGLWPFARGAHRFAGLAAKLLPGMLGDRARWLARLVRWWKPDVVHSLEFQANGYLTLAAKRQFGPGFPPWIATNWGSDISLFGRLPEHAARIRGLLEACDYYSCECERDVALARAFGFRGQSFPVAPNAGGFDLVAARALRTPGPTSARRTIAVKGYQTWAGRALVALRALALCADALKGYRIEVYLASPDVALAASLLAPDHGLDVVLVPLTTHEEILRLHGRARVSIGLSIGDAISTSFEEALVMGAFPIQSHTSCADEWVTCGETGFLVHPEDPEPVAHALRRALADDALVDDAARRNDETVSRRLDQERLREGARAIYRRVAEDIARRAAR